MTSPSILDDISHYLDGAGLGTFGTTIFGGALNDRAGDHQVVVYEPPSGRPPLDTFGHAGSLPVAVATSLQVVVRDVDYETAEAGAWAVWRLLTGVVDQRLPTGAGADTLYQRIAASGTPFFLTRDSKDRILFACNFDVMKAVPVP